MNLRILKIFLSVFALLMGITAARAQTENSTVTGAFTVERPTLLSLGFDWRISGDANRNALVEVSYRKTSETKWRKAMPMLRMSGEQVPGPKPHFGDRNYYEYTVPNKFAGSILNLEPDTEYETRFVLTDPDGVSGMATQTATVRTRRKPAPAPGGKVYHVYPFGYKGEMQKPGFIGLMTAYYYGSDESDHSNVMPERVRPGDTILMHAGIYKDQRFVYGGFDPAVPAYGTPFDGTYYLTASGTAEKPIVIKAAGDGEVIFDGDGAHNLFNLMAANYNYFEGITVRNTNLAFLLGIKKITGASGFTLIRSRLENIGRGVQADWAGSKDFYIADNVFIGRHKPDRITSWYRGDVWAKYPDFPALTTSEYGVKVYGQGHVVAHNYVANMHDALTVATYGAPDESQLPTSIDFYGNDMYNMADNCIESDGGAHNIRVFENRCFNLSAGAFSTQPIFGGPVYIYRNIVYQTTTGGPLKLLDTPAGIYVYQNTFIGQGRMQGPASNVHFRNNLFIGDGMADPVFTFRTFTNYSSSDYNGFRLNTGAANNFGWNSPDFGSLANYNASQLVVRAFPTLAEYSKATRQDRHSLVLDYDIFRKVKAPDITDPRLLYNPEDFDFRLRPGSVAIDKGIELAGITDGFTGRGPDLGALETGKPAPQYGPREWPLGAPQSSRRSELGPPRPAK